MGATFSHKKDLIGTVNPTKSINPINSVNLSSHFAFNPGLNPLTFSLSPFTFDLSPLDFRYTDQRR
jgi:hypothetical protein